MYCLQLAVAAEKSMMGNHHDSYRAGSKMIGNILNLFRRSIQYVALAALVIMMPVEASAQCGQKAQTLNLKSSIRYQLVLQYIDNEVHSYFNGAPSIVRENGATKIVYELNDLLPPELVSTLRVMGYNEGLVGTPHSNPGKIVYSIIRGGSSSSVVVRSECLHPDNQSPVRRDMFDHTYTVSFN